MTKRQFTEIERKVSEKNLSKMEKEIEYLEKVTLPKNKVAIETAPLEYAKQFSMLEDKNKEILNTIEYYKKSIEILKDQLENGVEEKKSESVDKEASSEESSITEE